MASPAIPGKALADARCIASRIETRLALAMGHPALSQYKAADTTQDGRLGIHLLEEKPIER
jgi:hypothetical protein